MTNMKHIHLFIRKTTHVCISHIKHYSYYPTLYYIITHITNRIRKYTKKKYYVPHVYTNIHKKVIHFYKFAYYNSLEKI